jgi:hypothetical protein
LSKDPAPPADKPTTDQTAKRQHTRQRKLHKVEPVSGEPGRYYVDSASLKLARAYIVDVLEGTCPCKGFSVRKHCTHLLDATDVHEKREAVAGLPPL